MAATQHQHQAADYSEAEQLAMYCVTALGFGCNALLAAAVLLQRHTRQVASAFVLHSCLINCGLAALCIPLAAGLQPGRVAVNSCNKLGVAYILLMTASVFNLVALACCEVYLFDNCSSALKRKPRGSWCCVLFGVVLVYTGSVILHLGPTLIGANFEPDAEKRCLLVLGQAKNYVVFTMWILIVTLALAAACYYLVVFHRIIGKTVQAKLILVASRQDEIGVDMEEVERRLDALAEIKHNRQRVLCVACGLHAACWYPLFVLLLADPHFSASRQAYRALTLLALLKCALEPTALLLFDTGVNRLLLRRLPCAAAVQTEAAIDTWMRAIDRPTSSLCGNRQEGSSVQRDFEVEPVGEDEDEHEYQPEYQPEYLPQYLPQYQPQYLPPQSPPQSPPHRPFSVVPIPRQKLGSSVTRV